MKIILFLNVLLSLVAQESFAVPEAQVQARFMSELVPKMQKEFTRASFAGVDGVKINYYYREIANPKGVIIVSPGKSESSLKYAELLFDLRDMEYSLYIIDHRGQGESGRMLADPVKMHVKRFADYVSDFSYFVNNIVKPANYRSSFILAHSMGGAVASGFLRENPNTVTGAVLCAPMLEINTGLVGGLGADLLANLLSFTGFSDSYAPMQKPYDPNSTFESNNVTSSRARFFDSKALYNNYPQLRIGGSTVNWVKQSLEYTTALRQIDNIYQVPTLLLQAGRDQLVMAHGQDLACGKLSPTNCKIEVVPGSQHEILMENDLIRNSALARIRRFITELAPK